MDVAPFLITSKHSKYTKHPKLLLQLQFSCWCSLGFDCYYSCCCSEGLTDWLRKGRNGGKYWMQVSKQLVQLSSSELLFQLFTSELLFQSMSELLFQSMSELLCQLSMSELLCQLSMSLIFYC